MSPEISRGRLSAEYQNCPQKTGINKSKEGVTLSQKESVISRHGNIPSVVNMILPSGSKVAHASTTFCARPLRILARRPVSKPNPMRKRHDKNDYSERTSTRSYDHGNNDNSPSSRRRVRTVRNRCIVRSSCRRPMHSRHSSS
jgi:hypothetical protein